MTTATPLPRALAGAGLLPSGGVAAPVPSLQQELAARFAEGDKKSGASFLMLVLMEEVGELAEAVRRGDGEEARKEVADVAFMAYALANVLDADLEEAIRAKFLKRGMDDVARSWTDVPR